MHLGTSAAPWAPQTACGVYRVVLTGMGPEPGGQMRHRARAANAAVEFDDIYSETSEVSTSRQLNFGKGVQLME